jgi:platelet-activating factor acetylhydrolase IB subunit beta/gamma
VVLLVGTNNHGHTPEQIADGIQVIIRVLQEKQPQAYLILPVSILLYVSIS